jgi:hypothetical protein
LAKPIVLKLPDHELKLLDQQRTILRFSLRRRSPLLRRTERLALRNDEGVCTCQIGRQRIIKAHQRRWNHKPMRLRTDIVS